MKTFITILLLISLIISGCAGLKTEVKNDSDYVSADSMASLRDTIKSEMKLKKVTGLSIAVADSEGLLWSEGFGFSDKKAGKFFNADTISNVGSVSKLITAAAVMKLVETGKINLDAPVSAYIEEFAPRRGLSDNPVTVRMLLNHESGLESDAFQDFFLGYSRPDNYTHSYRSAVDAVNRSGVVREPYTIFSYCNLGYSLLGCIIERTMGLEFQEAVKQLVFNPAGMTSSSFILDEIPEDRMSLGYVNGKPVTVPYIRDMPAGSLNSSANDMGRFLQGILASYKNNDGNLEQQTVYEMFTPSNTEVPNDLDFRIGLTWWIVNLKSLPGEYLLGHGGDLPPFHALVTVLPERDLAVFVMVNSVNGVGSFSLTDITTEAVRSFAAEKNQVPILQAMEPSPVVETPGELKKTLPGFYASASGLSEIKLTGRKLKIYAFNNWFDLYSHADGTMSMGMKILGIIPLKMPVFDEMSISTEMIDNSESINLRLQGVFLSPCIKIEPVPIDETWMDRCGTYKPLKEEIMPNYTGFKIEYDKKSGFLCLSLKSADGWSRFPLQTLDSVSAGLMGTGRGLGGKVNAVTEQGVEILEFLNFKLIKE